MNPDVGLAAGRAIVVVARSTAAPNGIFAVICPASWVTTQRGHSTTISGDIANRSGNVRPRVLDPSLELFGGRNRTAALVAIRLLEETYPSELADLLGVRLFSVQRIVRSLEGEGVIVSRLMGRTRMVTLNPRYFAHHELSALLWKLGEHHVALQKRLARRRRRPRRTGKPGLT